MPGSITCVTCEWYGPAMRISHTRRLALIWLLLSIFLAVFVFASSRSVLEDAVQEQVRRHLLLTLDESHFSKASSGASDQAALLRFGQQINTVLQHLVVNRWYSPQKECVVRLQRVDDVIIDDEAMRQDMVFSLPRNQIDREIAIGMSCEPNWLVAVAMAGLLGFFFVGIGFILPPPLSKIHRYWINYLLERGYSGTEAFEFMHRYPESSLAMNAAQLACLEQLHDSGRRNFPSVLKVVTDPRVATLKEAGIDWFLLGLRGDPDRVGGALELATAAESLEINLNEMTLSIRGLSVPIGGTPLFYYAWYAMHRLGGDGWITNPASNRPDPVLGQDLVELMSRYEGHARAINDLERTGLKARTLDQNRSKIKDDIVAALGEKLATAYLFEASRHPDGIHMRYRLHVEPHQIRIIS
jgi:hypothetical protein